MKLAERPSVFHAVLSRLVCNRVMDRHAYPCIGDGQTYLPQPWVQDRITHILYKTICDSINKSDQIDQGSSSSDDKLDYSVLYAKV
jgi:hypothetical protein